PQLPHERHADDAWSRLDRNADLQPGVPGDLHVLFPLVVAGKPRLTVARVTRRGWPARCRSSDGEPPEQPAVEPHIELLRPAHTHDVVLILPAQTDLDELFTVDGNVVADGHAAMRSKRKVLALLFVLHHVQRDLQSIDPRIGGGEADRGPRVLACQR